MAAHATPKRSTTDSSQPAETPASKPQRTGVAHERGSVGEDESMDSTILYAGHWTPLRHVADSELKSLIQSSMTEMLVSQQMTSVIILIEGLQCICRAPIVTYVFAWVISLFSLFVDGLYFIIQYLFLINCS